MNQLGAFKSRIFSLIAVFLFGNLIIRFPKGEGQQQSFWGYMLCFAVSLAVCYILSSLQNKSADFGVNLFDKAVKNVIIKNLLKTMLFAFALLCFMICVKDYVVMIDSIRLKETPRIVLSLVFVITILILSYTGKKVIYMFAFVNLIMIVLGVLVMFLFSAASFNAELLVDSLEFDFKNTLTQGLTFYIHSFGQIILCLLFVGYLKKKDAERNIIFGTLIGGIIFLISFLNVILMVGNDIIVKLQFPYAAVTGMITSSQAYNRLDAITYYIYFICALIKAAVLLNIITELYRVKRWEKLSVTLFSVVLAVLFSTVELFGDILQSKAVNLALLCLEIIIPVSIGFLLYRLKIKLAKQQ